jgi:dipeptidyl aminopeptidase/acylaminoacyl peptidase
LPNQETLVRRFTLSLVIALFSLSAGANAELRPVTHEDVWLTKRLSTPVVSPDGRFAVVAVTEPSYEEEGTVSDLWLIDVSGDAKPRRLTATTEAESGVDWSQDGSKIAFSTKRGKDEEDQIYVLNMDGPGEAVKITDVATGAKTPKWSPDGTRIAFESRIYPGAADNEANAAEKKAREEEKFNVSSYEIFPIRQWDRWRDDLQTHLFVQDAEAGAEATNLLFGSELVGHAGFGGVERLSGDSLAAAWTPDGTALVISATTNLDSAAHAHTLYHLYKVSAADGSMEQLTTGDDWSCQKAMFSDDGRALYCEYEAADEHVYNLTNVARFDWTGAGVGSGPTVITESFDRSVSGMDISANGKTVYVTAHDAGRSRVFSVPSKGGAVKALDTDSRGVYAGVQVAGRQLVSRWESSASPAEVVRMNASSGKHTALSRFNTELAAQLDRPAFEEFWFENANGHQVHSWITLPPAFDKSKKYPLVLLIHGGPFSSSLDADHVRWSPHLLASAGYVVLQTDYTGSVGYGVEFSRAIQGTPLKQPGDDLVQAAAVAIERYPFIDADRQAAAGASYGGHLVNWLQATTTHYKALVGHAGLVDLEGQYSSSDTIFHREIMNGGPAWIEENTIWRDESPATHAGNFSTPILLTIGEKDYRVPVNQTIAAWSYVQRMQVPGRLLVFHDANHWIMKGEEARYYWAQVHEFLNKYLANNESH